MSVSHAQQVAAYSDKDYARKPLWISMIKDSSVNFLEAEKAYKIYFQHHEKPGDEHDIIGEHASRQKNPTRSEMRRMQAEDRMRMEVKKYEHWRLSVLPYVQADGSVLTPAERLQIWKANKSKK